MTKLQKLPRVSVQFVFCRVCLRWVTAVLSGPYVLSSVRFVHPESLRIICLRTICPISVQFVFRTVCLQTQTVILHQSSCFEHFLLVIFIIRKLPQGRGRAGTVRGGAWRLRIYSHLLDQNVVWEQATAPAEPRLLRNQNVSRAIFLIFKQLATNWKFIHHSNKGSSKSSFLCDWEGIFTTTKDISIC